MSDDKTIRVRATLTGTSPLLMNPATDELIESLRKRTPERKRTDWSAEEQAGSKLYTADDGVTIGIPVTNLLASLVEAGRKVPLSGRSKVSTAKSTELYSFLSIEEMFLPFPADCQLWTADKRRGRNPNGGEMVPLVRPRFDRWSITCTAVIDSAIINETNVRMLFEISGRSPGLCDYRPGCRGPFGCSIVTAWDRLDETADVVSTNGKKNRVSKLVDV